MRLASNRLEARWWRVIRPGDSHVTWTDEDPSDRLVAAWEGAMVEGPFVPEAEVKRLAQDRDLWRQSAEHWREQAAARTVPNAGAERLREQATQDGYKIAALNGEVERLREALDKPLRETILAVLSTMPAEAAPEHLAAQIESQVRAWQAIPSDTPRTT